MSLIERLAERWKRERLIPSGEFDPVNENKVEARWWLHSIAEDPNTPAKIRVWLEEKAEERNYPDAEEFQRVRNFTGVELKEIKIGMRMFPSPDPMLGALFMIARGHAVPEGGRGREAKNRRAARDRSWARQRLKDQGIVHDGVVGG